MVAAALAILLSVSLPRFQQTAQRLRTEQMAFELAQLLRYAHERAVTQGQTITVVWDEQARRLHLEAEDPSGERAPSLGRFSRTGTLPAHVDLRVTQQDRPVTEAALYSDGTSDPLIVFVTSRRSAYTVTLDPATSQVSIAQSSLPP